MKRVIYYWREGKARERAAKAVWIYGWKLNYTRKELKFYDYRTIKAGLAAMVQIPGQCGDCVRAIGGTGYEILSLLLRGRDN